MRYHHDRREYSYHHDHHYRDSNSSFSIVDGSLLADNNHNPHDNTLISPARDYTEGRPAQYGEKRERESIYQYTPTHTHAHMSISTCLEETLAQFDDPATGHDRDSCFRQAPWHLLASILVHVAPLHANVTSKGSVRRPRSASSWRPWPAESSFEPLTRPVLSHTCGRSVQLRCLVLKRL